MKNTIPLFRVLWCTLIVFGVATTDTLARIGETQAEVEARYGQPDSQGIYHKGDFKITIDFHNGVVWGMYFEKPDQSEIRKDELSALMSANGAGLTWNLLSEGPPTKAWKRADGRVIAMYQIHKRRLGFITPELAEAVKAGDAKSLEGF
jgi:hypothetical protein